jgi:hypothetical protein
MALLNGTLSCLVIADSVGNYQFSSLYVHPSAQVNASSTHTDLKIPYMNLFYANKETGEVYLSEHNMKF